MARAIVDDTEVALGLVPRDESAKALRSLQGANGTWQRFRDDQDFDTRFLWEDRLFSRSLVTLEWTVPAGAAGTCRFVYQGDRRTGLRRIPPITATSRAFTVR
nr:neutral/alkaline non-lysosomal ceramidase C-terminal domain-containing protein [Kocuria palustris]